MNDFASFVIQRKFRNEKQSIETKQEQGQLLRILDKIKTDPKIYREILKQLVDRNLEKFETVKEAREYIESVSTDADALGVAKLIDQTLGGGTFRTLSFLDKTQDSAKSVFKLLKHNKVSL